MFTEISRTGFNKVEAFAFAADTLPTTNANGPLENGSFVAIWPDGDAGENLPTFKTLFAGVWRKAFELGGA